MGYTVSVSILVKNCSYERNVCWVCQYVNPRPLPATTGTFLTHSGKFGKDNAKFDFWCTFCRGNQVVELLLNLMQHVVFFEERGSVLTVYKLDTLVITVQVKENATVVEPNITLRYVLPNSRNSRHTQNKKRHPKAVRL